MNSHQRKKFAKALMSEIRNATQSDLEQALVDAAADHLKQDKEIERLRAENHSLKNELEALRKDAERWRAYRQYRATPSDDLAPTWNKYLEDSVMMQDCRLGNACDPDKLDAAIDAAMKGE